MVAKGAVSYNISPNGSAGDWYWEVASNRRIVARGLAPTMEQARVDALRVGVHRQPEEDLAEESDLDEDLDLAEGSMTSVLSRAQ
jgi:hypothetical protein